MDSIKGKLMELIRCANYHPCKGAVRTIGSMFTTDLIEDIASHLIANGVMVLPVQVGDTVYGRVSAYGKEVHQCKVVKVKACQFKDRTVRYFLDLKFDIIDPFYRDGRLMHCGMVAIYGEDWGDWYRVYPTREEAETQPPKGE